MKIAVIGGGISGLSAALILHPHHEVHLFEADHRLGGHAHTVALESAGTQVAMDTGFLVYNTLTYPHFTRLLEYLDVATANSDMSLSIQSADGLEWAGSNLATVFAQKRNLFRPSFLRMVRDILSFNKQAGENLRLAQKHNWTLEQLVQYRKHSQEFQKWYLLPMTGAIWSMSYAQAMQFPAATFLNFCLNHHLLQVNNRPIWRTIQGGSINYVKRIGERLEHIHTSSPVQGLRARHGKVLVSVLGSEVEFDKVVLATHAPVSRSIIRDSFPEMAALLAPFSTSRNQVDLHQDDTIMPKKKVCWSAWNVQSRESVKDEGAISLTYFLNKLQPLQTQEKFFITLNESDRLEKIRRSFVYDHPRFDFAAVKTQEHIRALNGAHGIFFAGAWTRYGFHEDGILSAVNVCKTIGCEPPWA